MNPSVLLLFSMLSLGQFRNTYYIIARESDYPDAPHTASFLDMDSQVLATATEKFKHDSDIEGTAILQDGRTLNFAGRKNGEIRYRITIHPNGIGVGNCPLIPFHTVAVDPDRIPLGSVVKIDETVGMILPDGSQHDGIWRAEDIGSAIKKDRIDLFVGAGDQGWVLERAHITKLMPLTLELISPPEETNCTTQAPQ